MLANEVQAIHFAAAVFFGFAVMCLPFPNNVARLFAGPLVFFGVLFLTAVT